MSLSNDAMVVRLNVSKWTARKYDKKISEEIASQHGTKVDVGRYNKVLINSDALKRVNAAASSLRSFNYDNTLTWDDAGWRLLPIKNFMNYRKKVQKLKDEFNEAANEFCDMYSDLRDQARSELKSLFDPADYPSEFEIRRKFAADVEIQPVPETSDFRVTISDSERKELMKELEERNSRRLKNATDDLYHRLADVIRKFSEKMKEGDKPIFRDSLVGNVVELVNLLPKLNVTDDPELDKIRKEVEKKIARVRT
jgi:hypothetical protein